METRLRHFKDVTVVTLRTVLHSAAVHPGRNTVALAQASNLPSDETFRALMVLADLGLIAGTDKHWRCVDAGLRRSSPDVEFYVHIRDAVTAYRPFEVILEGLMAGEGLGEALRHAEVSLDLQRQETSGLKLVVQWAVNLGILSNDSPPKIAADFADKIKSVEALPVAAAESSAEMRLYIATQLGREAFEVLDETDRGLLVDAARECDSDPAKSVQASGQALEDYLRELCGTNGLTAEAAKKSGAGQLAALLCDRGLIHSHHTKIVDAASCIRAAKAHKKDRKTVAPWDISPLCARTTFGAVVVAVRSIDAWINQERQIL